MKISCQSCGAKYNIADEKVRGKVVKIACKKCGARIEIDGREQVEQAPGNDPMGQYARSASTPGAGAMVEVWTVSIDDNDQREVSTSQLVELVAQGVVNAETFVWRDGMADWQMVRDVDGLREHVGAGPASAPADGGQSYAPDPSSPYSVPPGHLYSGEAHSYSGQPEQPQAGAPGYGHAASGGPSSGHGDGGYYAGHAASSGGGSSNGNAFGHARTSPTGSQQQVPSPAALAAQDGGAQARLGARRGGAVDLFAPATAPESDDDVSTSAPAGAALAGAVPVQGGRPIGARNENSVLFSLASLTSSANAPHAPAGAADEEKSGLIDIQKLAASTRPQGHREERAKLDDIMNLGGGGAFGAALGGPLLAPPPAALLDVGDDAAAKKKNTALVVALIAASILVVILAVVLVVSSRSKNDETARRPGDEALGQREPSAPKASASVAPAASAATSPSETVPSETQSGPIGGGKGIAGGGKGGAPAGAGGKGTSKEPPGSGASATPSPTPPTGAGGKPCRTLEECMGAGAKEPPKPAAEAPKPAAGGAEFDKAAAKAALGAVPYKDCGAGGGGKVSVTFSPGGSVSGASVTAGDYDAATKSCIASRFRSARVPAFSGDAKTVGWGINL